MMTKCGGGTSGYFGALRERGADIGSGGKSMDQHLLRNI